MTDIEQTGFCPDGHVLVDDTGVLHRHLPAEELDHFCPMSLMSRIKSGGFHKTGLLFRLRLDDS